MPRATKSGSLRESQENFWDETVWGIVEGSCGYRARGVSIGGNLGYKTRGWLNVVLPPGKPTPK